MSPFVDLMKAGEGWWHCAAWCGREVRGRGVFCAPCAWEEMFIVAERGTTPDDWVIEQWRDEMASPYRGRPLPGPS